MRSLRAVLALVLVGQPLAAQHLVPDSLGRHRAPASPVIRLWEAGALVGLTAGAMALDQGVRNSAQDHRTGSTNDLAKVGDAFGDKLIVLPALLLGTLGGRALRSKGLERASWHALESTAIAGGTVFLLKFAFGRQRPDSSPNDPFKFKPSFKDNSLPSGHTALAFALATSLSGESKHHWVDALFFTGATLTAFSRINDDKHWLSDTVFGAAVGIMSGRLVQRWHRPWLVGPGVVALHFEF